MRLTPAERWILANQYRLMQMLSDRPVPLYEHAIRILESGYEDQYKYAAQGLREDPFPQDVAEEVKDILYMFTQMQWVKDKITDPEILESHRFEFWGFDGNHSHYHLMYASFLHELGEFKELGNRPTWDSHSDTIETYRSMVRAWRELPRKGLQMTEEDVRTIVNAPVNDGTLQ
jgi:uncharacterized protein YfbU (UPF0304 family)